jgi:hypothetical protein
MTEEINKSTHNRRERIIGWVYVTFSFVLTTVLCCICLFFYSEDNKVGIQKEFAIIKMDRIRQFQSVQSEEMVFVDSIYNKIRLFNPSIKASYEDNDIKYYLNDMKSLFTRNHYDKRYKIFYHVSDFYNMWFSDRKELWSMQQNIAGFKKNLEECEIGLQKKKDELNSKTK